MPRGKRKKQSKIDINLAVVIAIILSILLAILIYTKAGYIGEHLSPMLGGIIGWIKVIIPIGTFLIGIYLACNEEDNLTLKLIQYGIFILCITTIMSVYQISVGNININNEMGKAIEEAYALGEKDIGGGAIGTIIAIIYAEQKTNYHFDPKIWIHD